MRLPRFIDESEIPDAYYSNDPYSDRPESKYNLRALVQYAKEKGKDVVDLTYEEVRQFETR